VIHDPNPQPADSPETWPHPFGYTHLPTLPDSAPRRGGLVRRWIGTAVLRALGWRLVGRFPDAPKLIVTGGPHTSNWDGIIGIAAIWHLSLDIRVMAKHTLFRGPSGWILRRMRAISVDRSRKAGATTQMVEHFGREEAFILGVTPEGTRKKVPEWKTGFYRIAEGAGVPILTVALDFGRKEIRLGPTFYPTGDIEGDFHMMKRFLASALPKNPENA
jgi:1-acyl-sn-glycerol-3-phosphate acyltransferase